MGQGLIPSQPRETTSKNLVKKIVGTRLLSVSQGHRSSHPKIHMHSYTYPTDFFLGFSCQLSFLPQTLPEHECSISVVFIKESQFKAAV